MDKNEYNRRIVPMRNWIISIAMRFLKNKPEAEDTSQDVFVQTWIMRSFLDHCHCLEAFVNQITQFHCIDKLRREKQRKEIREFLAAHQEVALNPGSGHDRLYIFITIREIAETLPPAMRDIYLLRTIDGLEYSEIAEKYGMNMTWVYKNISRARKIILEEALKLKLHELYRD